MNCPDYSMKKTLTTFCSACGRNFYGDDCFIFHLTSSSDKHSICSTIKKCLSCCKTYSASSRTKKASGGAPKKLKKHKCGWGPCSNCVKYVDIATNKCYIQPVNPKDDERKMKKKKSRGGAAARRVVRANDGDESNDEKLPTLFVHADFEAMTNEEGVQTLIMLCWTDSETDNHVTCYLG